MLLVFMDLILPFIVISLLSLAVILVVSVDYFFLENNLSEKSITEFTQQLLLLASIVIFFREAIIDQPKRTLYILIIGFFGCMLLRELDYYFDSIVHGFWLYPTLTLATLVIVYSFQHNNNLANNLRIFSQTKSYLYILIGLVIIMSFSRLLGSGSLWREVMSDDYRHVYKTIIQEGLELFGYMFIFIGALAQRKYHQSQPRL